MGKANFSKMRNVLTNLGLNIQLRVRLVKTYILAEILYGCESWTISAQLRRRLEVKEMWLMRKMLRIL